MQHLCTYYVYIMLKKCSDYADIMHVLCILCTFYAIFMHKLCKKLCFTYAYIMHALCRIMHKLCINYAQIMQGFGHMKICINYAYIMQIMQVYAEVPKIMHIMHPPLC